jgi:hypothetical protein
MRCNYPYFRTVLMLAITEETSPERGATSASASEVSASEVERNRRAAKVWAVLLWLIVTVPFLWGIAMTLLEVQNLFRR